MKKRNLVLIVVAASVGLVLCGVSQVMAKASGPCSDCHTMHDSQDNGTVANNGPNSKLLIEGGCIGCHTGTNDGTNNIPYVMGDALPVYSDTGTEGTATTLAGGNFWWVDATADSLGHNVAGITAADVALTTPPGWNPAFNGNGDIGGLTWGAGEQVTCAGTQGCHGTHNDGAEVTDMFSAVAGGHHGDDTTIDGSTVAMSYRFLLGIEGLEDDGWEYQPDASAHNQYQGVDRTDDLAAATNTISYLCSECHGDFHSGAALLGATADDSATSPWIRHPTDFDMANAVNTEYAAYNGGNGANNAYSVVAPVGSANVSTVLSVVTPGTADDNTLVTCISCHRAHGTPYADLLRWDYANLEADSGQDNEGCFICHTTKD